MPNDGHKRPLGRPPGSSGDNVRQQLLDAAHELFLSYEFKAVSVRQIAERAGVNGAMVNYYFGSKRGLYLAMVEQTLETLQKSLQELDSGSRKSLTGFVNAYLRFLSENPWWPNFMIREVLFGKAEFRNEIVALFGKSTMQEILRGIQGEIADNRYRQDLRPELAAWSLMGMMVFPFLSRPIAESILHIKIDKLAIDELVQHTCNLFLHGVAEPTSQPARGLEP